MLPHFHFPHYFSQKVRSEVGELYASSAIANFAVSVAQLFEPIYLFAVLGLSVPQVLLFMAGVYTVYIVTISLGARLASIEGYRHALAYSVPVQVAYWGCIVAARQNMWFLLVAAVLIGIQKAMYWPAFHAIIARYGEGKQVGREFAAANFITAIAHILGPLLGGYVSQRYGIGSAFLLAGVVYCCSIVPLLMTPEIFAPKLYQFTDTIALYKQYPKKFFGYMGFGEELIVLVVWPIAMYVAVSSFEGTGMVVTISSLLAACVSLVIGRMSDRYTKQMLIRLGALLTAGVWFIRFLATNFVSTLGINALSQASKEVAFVPIVALTYERAEETHIMPYVVFFEQSLAIGKLLACLVGALLFWWTGSFVVLFVLGGLFSLLYFFL